MTRSQVLTLVCTSIAMFTGGMLTGRESMNAHIRDLEDGWRECVMTATDPAKPLCPRDASTDNEHAVPSFVEDLPHDQKLEWWELRKAYFEAETAIIRRAIGHSGCTGRNCL